jgi:Phospholipase_D-nuclease N-terminal
VRTHAPGRIAVTRALPILVAVVLAVYALIDCWQTDPAEVPSPRRPIWLAMIILLPVVGPVAWIVASRLHRRPGPPRQAPRVVAPDDNPEFLREIRGVDDRHEKMLEEWEEDLRRREDEMRQQAEGDDDPR